MKTLRTSRLTLEPQVAAHAEEMFEVLSDPAIYEYEGDPPASVDGLRERFARLEARASPDGSERWLNWVIRADDRRLIGFVQATLQTAPSGDVTAAVAYLLASARWGRGLAAEATSAMLDELVISDSVAYFQAVLKRSNHRSRRLLERLGFTPEPARLAVVQTVDPDEMLMVLGRDEAGGAR